LNCREVVSMTATALAGGAGPFDNVISSTAVSILTGVMSRLVEKVPGAFPRC